LWPESVQCIVHVYNRTLTKSTNREARGKTPYEPVTGKKPDVSHLRIFGSKVKVLRLDKYKGRKVESKVWDGIHVGYDPSGAYRSYIPELGRVFISKDITFLEKLYRRQFTVTLPAGLKPSNSEERENSDSDYESADEKNAEPEEVAKRKSGRTRKPVDRYGDYASLAFFTAESVFGSFDDEEPPRLAEDALSGSRSTEWNRSM